MLINAGMYFSKNLSICKIILTIGVKFASFVHKKQTHKELCRG